MLTLRQIVMTGGFGTYERRDEDVELAKRIVEAVIEEATDRLCRQGRVPVFDVLQNLRDELLNPKDKI
jgi:hypothetical protein